VTQLIQIGQTLLSFILVLGILVFVHEFGHFIVAKAFKIAVPVFSLGFGPKIWGFRRRETEYKISAIPLGGYVRLAGDEADEHRTGAPEEFGSRPRWQRFLVFVAGATFNIVLAILVMTLVFSVWGKEEIVRVEAHPVIADVLQGSTAAAAGLRPGDKLLTIGGRDARDPQTEQQEILLSPNQTKAVEIEREGARMSLTMSTGRDPVYHLGWPGWNVVQEGGGPPRVETVLGNTPASRAGLERGDRVVGIEGRAPKGELEIRAILERSAGKPVHLVLERDGERRELAVTPADDGTGKGKIGVGFVDGNRIRRDVGLGGAFAGSLQWSVDITGTVFRTLGRLVKSEISVRAFSGPIEIARVSREAVRTWETFFTFLAFISLQLGILNLMPIPVLDGGHIVILALEGLIRRDLSDRVKERVMTVGFVFLLAFFGVVIFYDILKARM
jgi:regulator of sigma E protease